MTMDSKYAISRNSSGELYVDFGENKIFINEEMFILAYRWLYERQTIWYKKEILKEEAPWTEDPVLAKWKFINVHRKQDKGTQYILEKYLENELMPRKPEDVLFNILRYRLFNNRHSHEVSGGFTSWKKFDYDSWYQAIRGRWLGGNTVLSIAHNTCSMSTFPGTDKIERVCLVAKEAHKRTPELVEKLKSAKDMEEGFKIIQILKGYGPFTSYEVMLDMSYVYEKFNSKTWANVGPGAARGLAHIFKGYIKREELDLLRVLQLNLIKGLSFVNLREDMDRTLEFMKLGSDQKDGSFDIRIFESNMCELSKYVKLKNGTGRNFSGSYKPSSPIW